MSPFRLPTRTEIAPGASRRLGAVLAERGVRRALVVTDPGVRRQASFEAAVASVAAAHVELEVWDAVEANPRVATVEGLAERARAMEAGALVAIGGGSAIDAAKAAAMLATNGGELLAYVGKNRFAKAPLPFVAVPTTCGTGSEVTWVAVVTDPATNSKVSVKGDRMFPDAALVDADFLRGLPPALVASTGMDALTHAIEAVTGRLANPASDALAARAVASLLEFLPRAVGDPAGDVAARERVMAAATLAGMAFGNSDVGAVHCLSETLGGLFDVPHGLANALLLVPVQRYQLEAARAPLARLDAHVGGGEGDASRFVERLEALQGALALPSYASFGVPSTRHGDIAERAVANGSNASCPMRMERADYERILSAL